MSTVSYREPTTTNLIYHSSSSSLLLFITLVKLHKKIQKNSRNSSIFPFNFIALFWLISLSISFSFHFNFPIPSWLQTQAFIHLHKHSTIKKTKTHPLFQYDAVHKIFLYTKPDPNSLQLALLHSKFQPEWISPPCNPRTTTVGSTCHMAALCGLAISAQGDWSISGCESGRVYLWVCEGNGAEVSGGA